MNTITHLPIGQDICPLTSPLERRLEIIAQQDVRTLIRKDAEYKGSWKRRGGVGAFMMLARKWDRLEAVSEEAGYNVFELIESEMRGDQGASRTESTLETIRDLRRYLMLVESEMMNRKSQDNYGVCELSMSAEVSGFAAAMDETMRQVSCSLGVPSHVLEAGDHPLHQFFPKDEASLAEVQRRMDVCKIDSSQHDRHARMVSIDPRKDYTAIDDGPSHEQAEPGNTPLQEHITALEEQEDWQHIGGGRFVENNSGTVVQTDGEVEAAIAPFQSACMDRGYGGGEKTVYATPTDQQVAALRNSEAVKDSIARVEKQSCIARSPVATGVSARK
jgi:hypothetical protein